MRLPKSLTTKSGIKVFRILSGRSNVFMVTNGKENLLVDTGIRFCYKKLEKRLEKMGFDRINYLILTHSHFDHAGNARRIRKKYKPIMIIHKNEAENLLSGDFMLPQGTNFFTRFLIKYIATRFPEYFRCDRSYYDLTAGDRFDMKAFGFNVYLLHTPGHSPGSLSVIVDDEIALVGDCMFGIFPRSIFPPFATDTVQLVDSWGKLLQTNCRIFIPSHGGASSRKLVAKRYKSRSEKIREKGQT